MNRRNIIISQIYRKISGHQISNSHKQRSNRKMNIINRNKKVNPFVKRKELGCGRLRY